MTGLFELILILAVVAGWVFWMVERIARQEYEKHYRESEKLVDRILREKVLLEWGRTRNGGE